MSEKTTPMWDIGVGAVTLVVCFLLYWDSLSLPDPVFDPLGSVMVPRATCIILSLFALAIIVKGFWQINRDPIDSSTEKFAIDFKPRPGLAAGIFCLTMIYVFAMSTRIVRFSEITFVFVILGGFWMARFRTNALPILLILAIIMGYGGQYVFKQVFFVDLP